MKDMDKELQDGEGCRLYGQLQVTRMEGIVRLSTHVQDFLRLESTRKDLENQIQAAVEDIKAHHGVGNLEVCSCLVWHALRCPWHSAGAMTHAYSA
jgi:hypothetical protein